jgi:hypothetical protein
MKWGVCVCRRLRGADHMEAVWCAAAFGRALPLRWKRSGITQVACWSPLCRLRVGRGRGREGGEGRGESGMRLE